MSPIRREKARVAVGRSEGGSRFMGPKMCTFRGPSFRKKLGRGPRGVGGWDIQVRGSKIQASLGSQQICPSERYVPGHGMSKNEGVENREAWHV